MFFLNKHPAGKLWNFLFGIAELCDGLVRMMTLGFVATSLPLLASRKQTECMFKKLKGKVKKKVSLETRRA